jgi:hypothetical protein
VTVSDGQASTNTTFPLTVTATPPSLVAAYGFNEGAGPTVIDTSGNGNTGSISGATWTTAGKYGNALVFNGTNAVVTVANAASLQLTTGMTLEAWVYPTASPSGWRAVIDKNVDRYYLMASSTPNNRPAVGGTWTAGNQNTVAPSALAVNTWTHLAATFDGATVRLYVNGAQVRSKGQTTALAPTTGTLQIGGNSYPGEYFAGRIDEVRIYNRALTVGEIQADMNTAVGGDAPIQHPADDQRDRRADEQRGHGDRRAELHGGGCRDGGGELDRQRQLVEPDAGGRQQHRVRGGGGESDGDGDAGGESERGGDGHGDGE